MRRRASVQLFGVFVLGPLLALGAGCKVSGEPESVVRSDSSAYELEAANLTPAERRGREIWYKATAGGDRFHAYPYQQKFGVLIDWNAMVGAGTRGKRFGKFGAVTDPDCRPGNEASFGWDICPGDEGADGLLAHVGKDGWRDPGCDLAEGDVQNAAATRESGCDLKFGTSTGAVGFRKFPNPRFKREKWPGWQKYDPADAAIEPPFLVGQACGACHVGFDPLSPPQNPEAPGWENIKGLVGNAYLFMSEVLATGMRKDSPEWQVFTASRPGTTDTSAIPHDMSNNPGTINAIINFNTRPPFPQMAAGRTNRLFEHEIQRWRRVESCEGRSAESCQCAGKGCWEWGTKTETVFNILKGGEDNVGADLAVQRVYINIGSCSEQCWMNNLMDFRAMEGRNKYQTPFSIAQCRRDCPSWRAIEDRVGDIIAFLLSARPTDLHDALGMSFDEFVESPHVGGREVFETGRKVFAKECARCHSSQKPTLPGQPANEAFFLSLDFHKKDANGVRIDWMGNDEIVSATEVGSNHCRAVHSNHMKNHIWSEFASETYRRRPKPDIEELGGKEGGGRGYYRNISLLSLWAHAPFLHNNALGPEFCNDEYYTGPWDCVKPDPSVKGRLEVFEKSMDELLNPDKRPKKISRTDRDIVVELGPRFWIGDPTRLTAANALESISTGDMRKVELRIPKGIPITYLASLDFKKLADDLMSQVAGESSPQRRWQKLQEILTKVYTNAEYRERLFAQYSNCRDLVEDKGHEFGADLTDDEKKALIAFLKTI